mgnify:CR=1 FL=1
MATVTFEKRDTYLHFDNRNQDPYPTLTSFSGEMWDENEDEMLDENGDEMLFEADIYVNRIRLTFAKRDTHLVFEER